MKQCQQNVNDGYVYIVDMDLEKFFDTVCFETAPAFYAAASERIHTARVSVESGEKGV